MQIIWEEQDIKSGLRVKTRRATEIWMVAYDATELSNQNQALVSLTDGSIAIKGMSKGEIAAHLNASCMVPA